MSRIRVPLVLQWICLIGIATVVYASGQSHSIPQSVAQYKVAIERVLSLSSRQILEPTFMQGSTAANALLKMPSFEQGTLSPLESFDASTFELVSREMKGFVVNRDETVFVKPETDFWVRLADSKGLEPDREYFHLLKRTYPESVWPIYGRQATDYSGCTDFGTNALTQAYMDWTSFQRRFPNAYKEGAQHQLKAVLEEMNSTCACGDKTSVISELEYFLQKNPNGDEAEIIKTRLNSIRNDEPEIMYDRPIKMRYKCSPG